MDWHDRRKRVVVVGGTGMIGTKVVRLLRDRGHDVTAASTSTSVDMTTGEGVADALDGAQVVIDTSKPSTTTPSAVADFFARSAANLLPAERAAGVEHHVLLSIVGVDRAGDVPFYRAKAALEDAVRSSAVPSTIVRATQFFEFVPGIADTSVRGDVVRLPAMGVQPICGDDVADLVTEIAIGSPRGRLECAGPERFALDDFVRRGLAALDDPRAVVEDVAATYFGGRPDPDALLPGDDAVIAPTRFGAWLSTRGR